MRKLWLYLHFPQLQLDALLAQDPNIHQQAYVIWHEKTLQICQLNQGASHSGIRVGMGLGAAAMLNQDLAVVPYQEKVEQDILNEIAHQLYQVTSDISFWGQQGLLLQSHNMLSLHTGLEQYWQTIQQHLPVHYTYQYASAHSPLAARLLALTAWNTITLDLDKVQGALQPIMLAHTELSEKVIKKLARVGIHNVGQLLAIPFADLAKRFDSLVTQYIGQLTNLVPHPIHFFHPKQTFEKYLELLFDVEHTHILLKPLTRLLTSVERFLKSRDLLTQTIQITLHLRDKADKVALAIQSQQGEYKAQVWLELLTLQLEKVQLSAPVYGITVNVTKTYVQMPDKQDLFSHKQGDINHLQLLSLLQAKLGQAALVSPKLHNDYRPECSNATLPVSCSIPSADLLQAMRPSLLLTPPQRLQDKVNIVYGPERINTGWWDNNPVIRDYFIGYTTTGQWMWLFKTPKQEWYLHGIFS